MTEAQRVAAGTRAQMILYDGAGSMTLAAVRDGDDIWIWVDGALYALVAPNGFRVDFKGTGSIGLATRAGCGATFTDYWFSTDGDTVDGLLNPSVTSSVTGGDYGTVTLGNVQNGKATLGDDVTVTIALNEAESGVVNHFVSLKVEGKDVTDEATAGADGFTYAFRAERAAEVEVELARAQSVAVSGTVTAPAFNKNLLASGWVTVGGVIGAVGADGTYAVNAPETATEAVVKVPGFEERSVTLDLSGGDVTGVDFALTTADYGLTVGAGDWSKGEDGAYTVAMKQNGHTSSPYAATAYFTGITSAKYVIGATISGAQSPNGTHYSFGLALDETHYLHGQFNNAAVAGDFQPCLMGLRPDGKNWNNAYVCSANENPDGDIYITAADRAAFGTRAQNILEEGKGSMTLTALRDGQDVWIWIDGTLIARFAPNGVQAAMTDAGPIGLAAARWACGATFSDYWFSTDEAYVDSLLNPAVQTTVEGVDYGTMTVDGLTDGRAALGGTATVNLAPKTAEGGAVNYLDALTLNGVNVTDKLTAVGDGYTFAFTVQGETRLEATFSQAQPVAVSGTVTVPDRNKNLLTDGSVTIGGVTASPDGNGTYTVNAPVTATEAVVKVPGFEPKTFPIDISDGQPHTLEAAFTEKDYAIEAVSGDWTKAEDGSVRVTAVNNDNAFQAARFAGVTAERYALSATISEVEGMRNVYAFGLYLHTNFNMLYQFNENKRSNFHPCFLDIKNWSNMYAVAPNENVNGEVYISDAERIALGDSAFAPVEGGRVELTVIRDGDGVYILMNGQLLALAKPKDDIRADDFAGAAPFGFATRAGNGATFTDYWFTTDGTLIDGMLAPKLTVETSGPGAAELTDAATGAAVKGSVAIGTAVRATITLGDAPEGQIAFVRAFTENGVDRTGALEAAEGGYVYDFTAGLDTVFRLQTAVTAPITVSGRVTLPACNADLLPTVTVKSGPYLAQTEADGSYSISLPSGANALVYAAQGFIPKTLTVDGTSETADMTFMTADYKAESFNGVWTRNPETGAFTAPALYAGETQGVLFDVSASKYVLQVTVSDIVFQAGNDNASYGFCILGSQWTYFLQGTKAGVSSLALKAWDYNSKKLYGLTPNDAFADVSAEAYKPFEGSGSVTITLVRNGSDPASETRFYVGTTLIKQGGYDLIDKLGAGKFGFTAVYAAGATFGDYWFSTDDAQVDSFIAEPFVGAPQAA